LAVARSKPVRSFHNKTRGTVLASRACVAETFLLRAKGLLFTRSLDAGVGLYLVPCKSIHMIGMAYAIDAVFLDKAGQVVGLAENIKPGQLSAFFSSASGCLELPAGTVTSTGTRVGDQVEIQEAIGLSKT